MSTVAPVKKRESMLESAKFTIGDEFRAETVDLTLNDRCDSCNAAALVRAVKNDKSLFFCGNHGRKNVAALIAQGWLIDDQTYRAFVKPSTSIEGRDEK